MYDQLSGLERESDGPSAKAGAVQSTTRTPRSRRCGWRYARIASLVLAFAVPAVFKQTATGFVPAVPAHCPVYLNEDDDKWYCQLVGACEFRDESGALHVER